MSCLYFYFFLLFRSVVPFYLQDDTTEYSGDIEPCSAGCKNGGQCFLSSFCICPKGFSGRYCEVSLNEQCGMFASMTTIEVDCVLCICYNGLFMCDIQPIGLCRRKSYIFSTHSIRITRALNSIQQRFKAIRAFEPTTIRNVSLDDNATPIDLYGFRIVLNHSTSSSLSSQSTLLISICLLVSMFLFPMVDLFFN